MICARFFSAQKGKFLQIFRKYQKRFSESFRVDFCTDSVLSSQSLRRSAPAPFAQGSLCLCTFFLCATEKANTKSGFSSLSTPKVCTFTFCCSAACCHEPSSGRKVSRVSVTEGACGTEGGRKPPFSGVFKSIHHPLRRDALVSREPCVGTIFGFMPQKQNLFGSCNSRPF